MSTEQKLLHFLYVQTCILQPFVFVLISCCFHRKCVAPTHLRNALPSESKATLAGGKEDGSCLFWPGPEMWLPLVPQRHGAAWGTVAGLSLSQTRVMQTSLSAHWIGTGCQPATAATKESCFSQNCSKSSQATRCGRAQAGRNPPQGLVDNSGSW